MHVRSPLLRIALGLAALLATLALSGSGDAQEKLDLTGEWFLDGTGDLDFRCVAPATQTGTELEINMSGCLFSVGVLTGTIDPSTGEFNVGWLCDFGPKSCVFRLVGTATAKSMNGTWDAADFQLLLQGAFTGTATHLPTVPGDVSCDGVAEATDAAHVLRFDVGWDDPPPCSINGDLNGDRRVDSVDAAIILQCDAGLFDCSSFDGAA